MKGNSGYITLENIPVKQDDLKGIHDLFDQQRYQRSEDWPLVPQSVRIEQDKTSINETDNNEVTFTIYSTGIDKSTELNWAAVTETGSITGTDFNQGSSDSIIVDDSYVNQLVLNAAADTFDEGSESFFLRVTDSEDVNLGESSIITISDTSTGGGTEPSGEDITTEFYEISNRFIESDTYMGSTADYDGPYDVGEVQVDFSSSGRVYIGVKVTASTTFYNDVPIAAVQILDQSKSTVLENWIFNTSSGGSGSAWETNNTETPTQTSQGFPITPSSASGLFYESISTTTGTTRFAWANSTGSSNTGAAAGVATTSSPFPVGDETVTQSSGTYYVFRETSGSTRYTGVVMRSPQRTFSTGEWIRVVHAVTGYSQNPMDPDDTLYVAVT